MRPPQTVAAIPIVVGLALAGCGDDGGGPSSAASTARPIDPVKCLTARGVEPVRAAPHVAPARAAPAFADRTPDGRTPFSFGPPKGGEQFRIYVVPRKGQVPSLPVALKKPEAYEFVGYLEPPASPQEILRADDCLDGRANDEPRIEPAD